MLNNKILKYLSRYIPNSCIQSQKLNESLLFNEYQTVEILNDCLSGHIVSQTRHVISDVEGRN